MSEGLHLPTYVKGRTLQQLRREFRDLDDLIFGENACFGKRDLLIYEALGAEIERREKRQAHLV